MSGSEVKKLNSTIKQIDLTTDELLDAYKIAMKKLGREHKKDI